MSVPQQLLQAHDVQPIFEQMGGIRMPKCMGGKLLLCLYLGTAFLDDPLDARCGKGSYYPIFGNLTIKNMLRGFLYRNKFLGLGQGAGSREHSGPPFLFVFLQTPFFVQNQYLLAVNYKVHSCAIRSHRAWPISNDVLGIWELLIIHEPLVCSR